MAERTFIESTTWKLITRKREHERPMRAKMSENMGDAPGQASAGAERETIVRQPYRGLSAVEIVRDVLLQEQQFTTAVQHALVQIQSDLDAERQAHARVRAALEYERERSGRLLTETLKVLEEYEDAALGAGWVERIHARLDALDNAALAAGSGEAT